MGYRKRKNEMVCYPDKCELYYNSIDEKIETFKHKDGDAGYDMYVTRSMWVFPFMPRKVPVNLRAEIPEGFFGLMTSRSGESSKGNVVIPGIIDSNFRGQMSAIMFRVGLLPRRIKKGTRIAQLIVIPYLDTAWIFKKFLSKSNRGTASFGDSGKH